MSVYIAVMLIFTKLVVFFEWISTGGIVGTNNETMLVSLVNFTNSFLKMLFIVSLPKVQV